MILSADSIQSNNNNCAAYDTNHKHKMHHNRRTWLTDTYRTKKAHAFQAL